MKKIIYLIGALMLILTISSALAQETPDVTSYYNLSVNFLFMGNCDSDGVDTLVCTYPIEDLHTWEYGIFNTATYNLTLVDVPLIWMGRGGLGQPREVATCHHYSGTDNFYCAVTTDTDSTFQIIELSGDYTTYNNISTLPQATINIEDTPSTGSCDLKPDTDEIYCWTNLAVNPVYNNMWKYDIGDNTWTLLKNVPNPLQQGGGGVSETLSGSGCAFRPDTDELWCYGGGEFSSSNFNHNLTIYDTVLNTTQTIQNNGLDFLGDADFASSPLFCRWHNDVLYCYGGLDESLTAQKDIWYYNATTDEQGWISDIIEIFWGGKGSIGNKDYLISGFDDGFGEQYEVFQLEWSTIEEPSAPAVAEDDGDNVAGNLLYLQQFQPKAAPKEVALNPIEQLIINLRASLLKFRSDLLKSLGIEP